MHEHIACEEHDYFRRKGLGFVLSIFLNFLYSFGDEKEQTM